MTDRGSCEMRQNLKSLNLLLVGISLNENQCLPERKCWGSWIIYQGIAVTRRVKTVEAWALRLHNASNAQVALTWIEKLQSTIDVVRVYMFIYLPLE